jgi:type III secretory pathway lipoprotein EscJ
VRLTTTIATQQQNPKTIGLHSVFISFMMSVLNPIAAIVITIKNLLNEVIKGASGDYLEVVNEYINGTLKNKNVICNHHGEHHNH